MELLLKWIGGKKRFLTFIVEKIENDIPQFKNYHEPFFGSGALLFYYIDKNNKRKYYANDLNKQLINFYKNVKKNPKELIQKIKELDIEFQNNYYKLRTNYNDIIDKNTIESSAIFYIINKTCFNGIYRVNSNGKFNTPHGRNSKPFTFDEKKRNQILLFSKILKNSFFTSKDWTKSVVNAKQGDLVYLDPPYFLDTSSKFIGYTDPKFDKNSYSELFKIIDSLISSGVNVVLSNSNSLELKNLIEKNISHKFSFYTYKTNRSINPKVPQKRKNEFMESLYIFKGVINE